MRTLAGGIAHEINNKLAPIIGYAGTRWPSGPLNGATGNSKMLRHGEDLRLAPKVGADHSPATVELSKPSAPALMPLDLREPIRQAMTFLQLRIKESEHDVRTRPAARRRRVVLAEATQIKQLIVNLRPERDRCDGERRSAGGCPFASPSPGPISSEVLLVRDSGSGIAADCIDRVFDPFFTTKRSDKGTGLGLSVCSAIVRQHDGEISVESATGEGSTFTVTLPLARAAELSSRLADGGKQPGRARGRKPREFPRSWWTMKSAAGNSLKHAASSACSRPPRHVGEGTARRPSKASHGKRRYAPDRLRHANAEDGRHRGRSATRSTSTVRRWRRASC